MWTSNADLTKRRLIRLPTYSLIIDSQLATHRLVDLYFITLKLPESQLVTRKLLGLHFTDTQLTDCILESPTY